MIKKLVKSLPIYKKSSTQWNTAAGRFLTSKTKTINFKLPELDHSKIINWNAHAADLSSISYNMIIGNDLMKELQIDICYSTNEIKWNSGSIPLRNKNTSVEGMFFSGQDLESEATLSNADRLNKILDAMKN